MNDKLVKGMSWKLLERFGVQGIQFVIQIVLARLLAPSNFGVLSLMIIFVSVSNIIIQAGFHTSLIQNKDVTNDDYSSVFWLSFFVAIILYIALFFAAPFVGDFYNTSEFTSHFRVLMLVLIPGALSSVQLAKCTREMNFKSVFISNVIGIVLSGLIGVALAYLDFGVWALVAQMLLNYTITCIVMIFTAKWRPRLVFSFQRIKILFSFGWKILFSGLLDTVYQDLSNLVIGKKYNTAMLGYYNRGKTFPQFIITGINSSVEIVILSEMSANQDDTEAVRSMMRKSIILSSYIIFPLMAGLAGVAAPLVTLVLTEKWIESVPFLQIYCFVLAFYPMHTCNLQAINAKGRSDIFLYLEIVKKVVGIIPVAIAVFCFDSVIAIAIAGAMVTVINCFINAYPNKKLVGYSYSDQMKDILPSFLLAIIVFLVINQIPKLELPILLTLFVQVLIGGLIYISLSYFLKLKAFRDFLDVIKNLLQKYKIRKA